MKTLIQRYTFIPILRTVAIFDIPVVELEQVLLIVNKTTNTMIYNFADPTLNGTTVDNTIVLDYDTSAMNSSDVLQIYLDIPLEQVRNEQYSLDQQFTLDTNLNNVFGSSPLYDGDKLKTKTTMSTMEENIGRLAAVGDEKAISCAGAQSVAIQLSGTWVGTVQFEGSVDGGNFIGIFSIPMNNINSTSMATANSIYQINVAGLKKVRARVSAYTSGTIIVHMTATSALSRLSNSAGAIGSQTQLLAQRATSYELNTWDVNLGAVLGNTKLWRDGIQSVDYPIAPTINPTRPAVVDNKFATYPQALPRLRVEIGGDKRLPIAQEDNTNRLLTVDTDVRRVLEEILVQIQKLNQNFSLANGLGPQQGNPEVR